MAKMAAMGASCISERNYFLLPRCLPPSFCSIWLTVQEQITTEDVQDGRHAEMMDTILMEMLKMWKATDGNTDEEQTMVNRPQHKLAWGKAPGELAIEDVQDGCCGCHPKYHKINGFSNYESPCRPNSSYQILVKSDLVLLSPLRSSLFLPYVLLSYCENQMLWLNIYHLRNFLFRTVIWLAYMYQGNRLKSFWLTSVSLSNVLSFLHVWFCMSPK